MNIMELILTIVGLFGIPSLYFGIRSFIFKQNIEFHKILQSFPSVPDNKINDGTKTTCNGLTKIEISEELNHYFEKVGRELDVFLDKLGHFDENKLIFKKKKITAFKTNIKRLLESKSSNIQYELGIVSSKQFNWTAFNYIMVNNIIKNKKQIDKLYICKFLEF